MIFRASGNVQHLLRPLISMLAPPNYSNPRKTNSLFFGGSRCFKSLNLDNRTIWKRRVPTNYWDWFRQLLKFLNMDSIYWHELDLFVITDCTQGTPSPCPRTHIPTPTLLAYTSPTTFPGNLKIDIMLRGECCCVAAPSMVLQGLATPRELHDSFGSRLV